MHPHGTHPRDHLRRAKALLKRQNPAVLFYVAFELRCAIEGRLKQYAKVQDHLSKREIDDYRISNLYKAVTKLFDREMMMSIVAASKHGSATEFLYTPVTRELRDRGGKLGDLLHYRGDVDQRWYETVRTSLSETARLCEISLTGTMLMMPTFRVTKRKTLLVNAMIDDVRPLGRVRRDLWPLSQSGFPMLVYGNVDDYRAKRPLPNAQFKFGWIELPPPRVEIARSSVDTDDEAP